MQLLKLVDNKVIQFESTWRQLKFAQNHGKYWFTLISSKIIDITAYFIYCKFYVKFLKTLCQVKWEFMKYFVWDSEFLNQQVDDFRTSEYLDGSQTLRTIAYQTSDYAILKFVRVLLSKLIFSEFWTFEFHISYKLPENQSIRVG